MGEITDAGSRRELSDLPQAVADLVEQFRAQKIEHLRANKEALADEDARSRKQEEIDMVQAVKPKELLPDLLNNFANRLPGGLYRDVARIMEEEKLEGHLQRQQLIRNLDEVTASLGDEDKGLAERVVEKDKTVDPEDRQRILGFLFARMVERGFTIDELRQ